MSLILVLPEHDAERPLAWGRRLAEAGVGDMDDDVESEDSIGEHDRAGSKGGMSLALDFAPREVTTVVTPSAKTRSDLNIFDGGTSSDTPRAVPLESITDDGDDENDPEVLPKSKGKGKSRGREASAAPGADDTMTVEVPSSRASLRVEGRGGSGEAEAAVKCGTEEEEDGSPRPKRLKVGHGRLAAVMAQDGTISGSHAGVDPCKYEQEDGGGVGQREAFSLESISGDARGNIGGQSSSKHKPEEEAVRGHGVDGSGDEGDDIDGDRACDVDSAAEDDNFDFPSIIDADPDSD